LLTAGWLAGWLAANAVNIIFGSNGNVECCISFDPNLTSYDRNLTIRRTLYKLHTTTVGVGRRADEPLEHADNRFFLNI
jgi:hypothetical protein